MRLERFPKPVKHLSRVIAGTMERDVVGKRLVVIESNEHAKLEERTRRQSEFLEFISAWRHPLSMLLREWPTQWGFYIRATWGTAPPDQDGAVVQKAQYICALWQNISCFI